MHPTLLHHQAVEGSLSGLDVAQGENIRRLSLSLNSALADAESALQVSVRSEVSQSLEPVRRLPQMLAAIIPPTPLPGSYDGGSVGDAGFSPRGSSPPAVSEAVILAAVRAAVSEEVSAAVQQAMQQADARSSRAVTLVEEQWEALGRRLSKIERLVEAVPEATEAAIQSQLQQQLPLALSSSAESVVSDLSALTAREMDSLRAHVDQSRGAASDSLASGLEDVMKMVSPLKDSFSNLSVKLEEQADSQQELAAAARSAAIAATAASSMQPAAADLPVAVAPVDPSVLSSVSSDLSSLIAAVKLLDGKLEALRAQQEVLAAERKQQQRGDSSDSEQARALSQLQEGLDGLRSSFQTLSEQVADMTVMRPERTVATASSESFRPADTTSMPPNPKGAAASSKLDAPDSNELPRHGQAQLDDSTGAHSLDPTLSQTPAVTLSSGTEKPQLRAAEQRLPSNPYFAREMRGQPVSEMVAEGLRLLKLGREEARLGADLGLADQAIRSAIAVLQAALNEAPYDPKVLGNLGNALLAQGEVKKAYLEAMTSAPAPVSAQEVQVQRSAEASIKAEAIALLTQAGEMFKKVLELEGGWSSRGLVNWGRAMCLRAELADSNELAAQLYNSALDKFEAVLEEDPGMVTAKYRAAVAMQAIAARGLMPAPRSAAMLREASNYFRAVAETSGPDAEALREASRESLLDCEEMLRGIAAKGATASPASEQQAGGGLFGGWAQQLKMRR